MYEPSERARLGKELEDTMSSGEEVPEQLIVDLLVNALQDLDHFDHLKIIYIRNDSRDPLLRMYQLKTVGCCVDSV